MAREYQRTVWQNEPNTATPVDADNLNHIENGIYNLETKVENKVDKVNGKGLSTNDFTNEKNSKLAGIETGAQANVQSDFSQNDSSADDYIKNKPNMANYATKTYVDNSFTIAGKKSGTTLGTNATAEGTNNTVTGSYGHGEGNGNTASGYAAHAENYETTASGFFSHSQGYGTIANGESQHVAGKFNVADNNNTYAEIIGGGSSDDSRANIRTLDWNGNAKYSGNVYAQNNKILAKAEDVYTKSEVDAKVSSAYHPAGTKTVAQLTSSLLVAANIGNVYNITDSGTTTEYFSEGSGKPIRVGDNVGISNFGTDSSPFILFDLLSGFIDTSEFATNSAVNTALSGKVDKVNGKGLSTNDYTTSEKEKLANINLTNYATKDYVDESYTIAGKAENTTVGSYSTAEGHNNTATGNHVHVEGYGNTATGAGNHAEGYGNTISGQYGHVEGTENTVSGHRTHVEGTGNIGSGYAQHVSGKYNVADNNGTYAEIVGGGEDSTHRANIRTLDWDGTGRYAGDLYVHDSRKVLDTNDKKEVASTFKDKYDESSIPSTYTTKYYSMGHPSTMYPATDYGSATTCCINVKNGNWYSYTDSPDDAWVLEDELPLRGGGAADNLTDLGDVNINSPLGGQVLAYNNSQQKWYNKSLKEYGGIKEQAIDASETIYPLSKITSELQSLLFRVDGQLHTGQYVYYVEAEGKYFVTDTNGKLFKSYWLHYNTQEEYYSEVNTNIEFTKFLWVSNDNIIGYSTDGYLYYASINSAFNGNFTQSEEIGTNLDFVNFYEFDGYVYCVTNNAVWMSQTFGQTWMRIKTGTFTNSMCGGGILAYTTSTKVYVECVGENDFKEYNLPITNGKTIYGKGLFICYTDGEIHVSYDGCQGWIEKQTFIKNGSVVYVSDLTDDLLIRYTKGIFGICNDNVWDLSFDFDNLIIISDYANDDYVSLWCNYSDNKYVYDVDSIGEFYYGEYLTTNIPQKVENNLAELHDVATNNLQNNQILKYNATSQKWENSEESGNARSYFENYYPMSKVGEVNTLKFRYNNTLYFAKHVCYIDSQDKYMIIDRQGGIWITDVLDDVTYYSNVSSNVTFEKFKWLSNDNVIGYGTDGHIYYADAANALGGHFTQTTEIGTNLDFINFYEVDGAIYCITDTGVWESSDYGITWTQIKTGTYTNSLCGDGMIAYTTSTKIYIKNGTDFVEYNLPITSGNTVYGNGIFVCYTDGVIYTSTNCCNTWVRKYLFIDEAGGEWNTVNYLSDDLLITYTHGAFGICNYTQWALSYDFNIILSLSTYTDESSLNKWFDDGNNEYVYSTYENNVYYAPYKTVKNIGIGKGLSSNDYTTAEKTKLEGIEAQANKTIVDSSMSTTSTNPLQNKIITAELAGTTTATGNPLTIKSAEANLVECKAEIESVQDLHGYDKPWVGGAGKNKLPMTVDGIKSANTSGSWSGNSCTINGVTFTIQTDSDGNVIGIKVNGTASADAEFILPKANNPLTTTVLSGCPSNGSASTYFLTIQQHNGSGKWGARGYDYGSGVNYFGTAYIYLTSWITIKSGYTANNLLYKPMIRLATETDPTFEPYSNISPIIGQTEVVIEDCGKNLFDINNALNGYIGSNGEFLAYGGVKASDYLTVEPNKNYALSYYRNEDGMASGMRIAWYDENKNFIRRDGGIEELDIGNKFITATCPSNGKFVRVSLPYGTLANKPQLELGNTATDFEPYKGKTYTIQLGDTIYGGELDVLTGELIVTHGEVDLGDSNWQYSSTTGRLYFAGTPKLTNAKLPASNNEVANIISSAYQAASFNAVYTNIKNGTISLYIDGAVAIYDSRYTDATAFKTAVTGQKIVYELAEPYTIQLTPQQIRLLKGTNNISCNTGDLSIKYYPDNVLGQLKGDIEDEYDERVETLETQVQELQPSLIFMSRERRDITSDLSRLPIAVAEQNLEKYGYKIGDYFERVDGNRTYTYHIADPNTYKGTSTPYCLTQNHYTIVVDTHSTSQWYSGDASAVGYNGSTLHTYLKGTVLDNIKADMIYFFGGTTGLEHLLSHSKLLTTALANWGWQANQYISALTCTQIDAGSQWTANGFQEGEASKSLELFRKHKWTEIFESRYPWLRNLSNYSGGSAACYADYHGYLDGYDSVADPRYVVGLIIFH